MGKLTYFRCFKELEFNSTSGEVEHCDCNELTLVERLIVSAYLTMIRQKSNKTLAEIIFDYDGFHTPKNFADFDNAVSRTLKKYAGLFHYLDNNANALNVSAKDFKTFSDKYEIYAIEIDTEDIFNVQNGRTGRSIYPIAWKAFALAAAASKYTNINTRRLHIFNWLTEEIKPVDLEMLSRNKTQTKNAITNWLEALNASEYSQHVYGEFKGGDFIVDVKGFNAKEIRGKTVQRKQKVEA